MPQWDYSITGVAYCKYLNYAMWDSRVIAKKVLQAFDNICYVDLKRGLVKYAKKNSR